MPSPKLSSKALDAYLGSRKMVVMFAAPWCTHCNALKPTFDQFHDTMVAERPELVVARYDADKHQQELASFGRGTHGTSLDQVVRGYPTVVFFDAAANGGNANSTHLAAGGPARASVYQGQRTVDALRQGAESFFASPSL